MRKAFTLIELLIVIAIITILALIAIPNFLEAQVRADVARLQADMRTLATAIESYMVDYNNYPIAPSWYDNNAIICVTPSLGDCLNKGQLSVPHRSRAYAQGIREFTGLSTPVAYIQSTNFVDPFLGGRKHPVPTSSNIAVWPGFYFVNFLGIRKYAQNCVGYWQGGAPGSWSACPRAAEDSPFPFRFNSTDPSFANTSYTSWNPLLSKSRVYNSPWSLCSIGPDRTWLQPRNSQPTASTIYGGILNFPTYSSLAEIVRAGEFNQYDPSNGSQSIGDIWRLAGGADK